MDDKKFYNALNLISTIGNASLRKLVAFFPTMKEAWNASDFELKEAGLEQPSRIEFLIKRKEINPEKEFEKLEKENIKIITRKDDDYPELLKETHNPPEVLYIKGSLLCKEELIIGVVGTRNLSPYGKEVTEPLVFDLINYGFTIVSGMARGIDTLAHKTALSREARTIAVVGSGLDSQNIYPSQNRHMAETIAQNGAVISEYPYGTPPLPQYFPLRNRIIAGLSLGVLVIEAPEKSGALITAEYALEEGREVFAVPGPIFARNSQGTNNLIKRGAKPVTRVEDILEELNIEPEKLKQAKTSSSILGRNREENIILEIFKEFDKPLHIDEIIKISCLDSGLVSSSLTIMEIDGKIRNLGGGLYTTKCR